MFFRIKILNAGMKGEVFDFEGDGVSIGRTPENTLVLDQASVSRSHAIIRESVDGGAIVEDLGSRNKTKVDGRPALPTLPVPNGATLAIGDVLLAVYYGASPGEVQRVSEEFEARMRAPAAQAGEDETGDEDEEETPAGGVSAPVTGAAPAPAAPGPAARGPAAPAAGSGRPGAALRPAERIPESWLKPVEPAPPPASLGAPPRAAKLKGWIALGATVALAIGLSAYLSRDTRGTRPVRRLGQVVMVGQKRVTEVPFGFIYYPEVSDEGIVKVYRERGMTLFIIVEGVSEGLATVKLYNRTGTQFIVLHVKVMPASVEGDRTTQEYDLTPEQRVELASKWVDQATAIRRTSPFEAMKLYADAVELLRTVEPRPPLYNMAITGYYAVKDDLEKEYDDLVFQMKNLIAAGDQRGALDKLNKIKELIPDPQDWRRQDAELRYRLLQDLIRRREEMERKTL